MCRCTPCDVAWRGVAWRVCPGPHRAHVHVGRPPGGVRHVGAVHQPLRPVGHRAPAVLPRPPRQGLRPPHDAPDAAPLLQPRHGRALTPRYVWIRPPPSIYPLPAAADVATSCCWCAQRCSRGGSACWWGQRRACSCPLTPTDSRLTRSSSRWREPSPAQPMHAGPPPSRTHMDTHTAQHRLNAPWPPLARTSILYRR